MAKGPGWYPDPWGGQGLRWWDGSGWSEHVQGQPGPGMSAGVGMRQSMASAPQLRRWWHSWFFILPVSLLSLFFCAGLPAVVLIWYSPSTPMAFRLVLTVLVLAFEWWLWF